MVGLIDVMQWADFDCDNLARLVMHEEVKLHLGLSPFLLAATLGLLPKVKSLLDEGEGVDASLRYGDDHKISTLDAAALMGHLEVVRTLLEHGVDVDDAGPDGETALHNVVIHGRADPDVIDLLLSAGADIDARERDGFTPLHLAAGCLDSDDAAAILLRRGASKDAVASAGHSPLHCTVERVHLAATRALLAAGADANLRAAGSSKIAPLCIAAYHGRVEIVKELVRHGVDVNSVDPHGLTALHHAARLNKAGAADALVAAGASITAQARESGATPLHCAVISLALQTMAVLLRHEAPVWKSQGGGADRIFSPPLHLAARQAGRKGAVEAVDLLLRWGADESEMDKHGKTAAERVGTAQVPGSILEAVESGLCTEDSLANGEDRVRKLLANAPADRTWRRRGLLLLCLARDRTTRRRTRSGGKGKWKMKGKGVLAKDGGGSSGGGFSALPWIVDVGVSAATAGRCKREKTPSKVGDRRARSGGGSSSSSNGCSSGDGGAGRVVKGYDFGGIVAMLLEFKEEGLFRTIVGYL